VHQPPHIAMALMSFVRQLAQKRPYLADLIAEGPEGAPRSFIGFVILSCLVFEISHTFLKFL